MITHIYLLDYYYYHYYDYILLLFLLLSLFLLFYYYDYYFLLLSLLLLYIYVYYITIYYNIIHIIKHVILYISSKYIKITFPDVPGTQAHPIPSQRLRYRFLPISPRIDTLQALLRGVQLRAQLLMLKRRPFQCGRL